MKKLKLLLCVLLGAISFKPAVNLAYAEIVFPSDQASSSTEEEPALKKEEQIERFRNHLIKATENLKKYWKDNNSDSERLARKFCLNDLTEDDFDLLKLKPWADKLFAAINSYIKASEGCSVENFDEYVINNMVETGGEMTCVDRAEFEKFCSQPEEQNSNNSNIVRLYRGISNMQFLQDFRNGKKFIGGHERGEFDIDTAMKSYYGHGVYTAMDKMHAEGYDTSVEEYGVGTLDRLTGGVAEMAFDKTKAKGISQTRLDLIKLAFFYFHPEFCNIYKVFDKNISFRLLNSFPFCFYEQAYEKVFGRKIIDVAKECGCVEQNGNKNESTEAVPWDYHMTCIILNILPVCDQKFSEELEKLMNENKKKAHFSSKEAAVLDDEGLLTKLLGFDYFKTNISTCLVVNFGVLTICKEGSEFQEKSLEQLFSEFESRSPYL